MLAKSHVTTTRPAHTRPRPELYETDIETETDYHETETDYYETETDYYETENKK